MRALPRELGRENVEQGVDRVEDPPVRERVADVGALTLGDDEPLVPEDTEVTRGQGLARADGLRELPDGARRMTQLDEEEQPVRIGKRFTELGVEPEDLLTGPLVRGGASPRYAFIRMYS